MAIVFENKRIYTTIDDINYHLSNIFALYPSFYAQHVDSNIWLHVIAPLIKNSKEFCDHMENGKITIGRNGGAGSFSAAGNINIHEDGNIKTAVASGISFSVDGKSVPYYMDIFAKRSLKSDPVIMKTERKNGVNYIYGSDAVHEGLIGALASHLFDMGFAPSFMKYMGLYICDDNYKTALNNSTRQIESISTGTPYFVFERSDVEMSQLLGNESKGRREWRAPFSQTTAQDYMIWLTQLAHTQFVGKHHFGITHADMHTRNMMLTYVKNKDKAIKRFGHPVTPFTYGGVNLAEADYYEYILPFFVDAEGNIVDHDTNDAQQAVIRLDNNGFLAKQIDFGLSIAELEKSVTAKQQNVVFSNDPFIYASVPFGFEAINSDTKGDLDYNYAAINILWRIWRACNIAGVGHYDKIPQYKKLWGDIEPFFKATLPNEFDPKNITAKRPHKIKRMMVNDPVPKTFDIYAAIRKPASKAYFPSCRAVGTTTDITMPLKKIWKYMVDTKYVDGTAHLHSSIPDKIRYVHITRDNVVYKHTKAQPPLVVKIPYDHPKTGSAKNSNMHKFIQYNFGLWQACITNGTRLTQPEIDQIAASIDPHLVGKNQVDFCNQVAKEIEKYNPNSRRPVPFFKNLVSADSIIWNKAARMLNDGITQDMLLKGGFKRSLKSDCSIFTLRFNPSQLNMAKLANTENFVFEAPRHVDPDGVAVDAQLDKNHMKLVNVHLIYTKKGHASGYLTKLNGPTDLYTLAKEHLGGAGYGITLNAGFSINQEIISDPLNKPTKIDPGTMGIPVGYYYSNGETNRVSGTSVPIPRAYHNNFATIFFNNGNISIVKSPDFLKQHKVETKLVGYTLTDRTPHESRAVQRRCIKMFDEGGKRVPKLKNGKIPPYETAFETGPILIWDGDIVHTKLMNEQLFTVDALDIDRGGRNGVPLKVGERYKINTGAQNSNMYFVSPGETSIPYGQRVSNALTTHTAICETRDSEILFVTVEGRGYDSLGIDRVQLAELISRFNVVKAVVLDGGAGANVVFKNPSNAPEGYYWLVSDPVKNLYNHTIHFGSG